MGEVYRATDASLNREVAIKVLPPEVAKDPERLARFRREAQLLASLNHPNIAAIHGLEEAEGKPFLALELVEGEDLKERLARGAIPVDETLEIAEQIAEALEEAHKKGIVHRDLKPANVKLTPDGKVKVLDFGLAKAWSGDAGSGGSSIDLSQSPTLARTGTLAGVILGTAAYMSPEQASGKGVDKRADIWSFGTVLFEMLTGESLYSGETASEVMASVIKEEPAWHRLPAECPPTITKLLRRCLRKRPRERLQDIGDARLELEEALAGTVEEGGAQVGGLASTATELPRLARQRWAWAAVALVSAGFAAVVSFLHFTEAPELRPAAHFVLDLPEDLSFGNFDFTAVSPDGRDVAFAGVSAESGRRLWVRLVESSGARPLSGTEGATRPFWSPDGGSIAFSTGEELKELTLASGTVQRICSLPRTTFTGGTWNAEGTIVFSTGGATASLFSVAATGGEAKPLGAHDESRGETGHWMPWFLPDGRHFLFDVGSTQEENSGVNVASLGAPDERRRLLSTGTRVVSASGHLLFVRDGVLLAQPFDDRSLELSGDPAPVADDVGYWSAFRGWGHFSASPGRVLAYRTGGETSTVQLAWVDRKGERLETVGEPGPYEQIALSPDEKRIAVEVRDVEGQDLWVIDAARGVASRLTSDPGIEFDPVWSPDSREIAFGSSGGGEDGLLRKGLQGEPASPLSDARGAEQGSRAIPESWSSDGATLLYKTLGGRTVFALSVEGGGEAEAVLETSAPLDEPQLSPDGQWLAYVSRESGAWEVYVAPFRRPGERVRASVAGGGQPRWRGDGKELFYVAADGQLMAVDVRAGEGRLEIGLPTQLFAGVMADPYTDHYAVSADGQRFLVKVPVEGAALEKIHVVTNWTSLLK
jgi:Tol biopolymer transport system component